MTIKQKLKIHKEKARLCKIKRQVAENSFESNNCVVVDTSAQFVLVQEIEDFSKLGYLIFPIAAIREIRYDNNDKYYDKILRLEKVTPNIRKKYDVDLSGWTTIFKSIRQAGLNVIIENENPADKSFDIGPLVKVTGKAVYLQYFNARGILDDTPTKINFDLISLVKFDDPYINIFSKYLRRRNQK